MTALRPAYLRPQRRARVLLWLIGALLLAQTLALAHRSAHGLPALHPALAAASGCGEAGSTAAGLFTHDPSAPECKLYDALGGLDIAPAQAEIAVVALPTALITRFLGESLARWATLFDARGPPLPR